VKVFRSAGIATSPLCLFFFVGTLTSGLRAPVHNNISCFFFPRRFISPTPPGPRRPAHCLMPLSWTRWGTLTLCPATVLEWFFVFCSGRDTVQTAIRPATLLPAFPLYVHSLASIPARRHRVLPKKKSASTTTPSPVLPLYDNPVVALLRSPFTVGDEIDRPTSDLREIRPQSFHGCPSTVVVRFFFCLVPCSNPRIIVRTKTASIPGGVLVKLA